MLISKVETYADVVEELKVLYRHEWDEVAPNRDRPQAAMQIDYARYAAMDALDMVMVTTLRDGSALVGYFNVLISPALHSMSCLTAYHDMFYILPAYRGRYGSVRLLRTVKKALQARGVHRWVVGSTAGQPADRLYAALGFEPSETFYSMWLGGSPGP